MADTGRRRHNLTRFLRYLVAALQPVLAGIGQGVLVAPDDSKQPAFKPLLSSLINDELEEAGRAFVLVLDNYQEIEEDLIHRAVAFLIEQLPHGGHLVISTRSDPPLPLSRCGGRGQLDELHQSELCFTAAETSAFFNELTGFDLTEDEVCRPCYAVPMDGSRAFKWPRFP